MLTTPTTRARYTDLSAYPSTERGWADCYDRRWASYVGADYDVSEITTFHLFRALDENNAEIDVTRRVFNLTKFIVDTDVGGVLGGRVALEVEDGITEGDGGRAALLVAGESVWKRSRVGEVLEGWVRSTAVLADFFVEAMRTRSTRPYRTTLVGHDARNVTPTYDQETGTRLLSVVINTSYFDPPYMSSDGVVESGALHTYRREIDETEIRVYVDGRLDAAASGPHGAGVCPVAHIQWAPFTAPEHGLPAASGIERILMMLDSLSTQAKAIGTRFANPILWIAGAKLAEGADVQKFGRGFSGPAGMTSGYLEPSGAMVQQIREIIREHLDYIQDTEPEFVFADSGINVSADAKLLKASAYENKINNARTRIFSGLARITAIAVAMDAGKAVDDERIPFRIDAPPVLPRNVPSEVATLLTVRDALLPEDLIRHLQRLGIVPIERDPAEYVAAVAATRTGAV